jgi:hypothetical protein
VRVVMLVIAGVIARSGVRCRRAAFLRHDCAPYGHFQLRISGMSSPCSSM